VDRVLLDANVLFSAAYREETDLGPLWKLSGVVLLSSDYAIDEARRNLPGIEQHQRLDSLPASVAIAPSPSVHATIPRGVALPAKDRPILAAAMESAATHLLTGDLTHFGALFGRRIGGVLILTPAMYLRRRRRI
jgi:predicted nucleic acid-binding protein